jgi:hypothetical protein
MRYIFVAAIVLLTAVIIGSAFSKIGTAHDDGQYVPISKRTGLYPNVDTAPASK